MPMRCASKSSITTSANTCNSLISSDAGKVPKHCLKSRYMKFTEDGFGGRY